MITALKDEATKRRARELGAREYITKPFSHNELGGIIMRTVNDVLRLEEKGSFNMVYLACNSSLPKRREVYGNSKRAIPRNSQLAQ